MFLLDGFDKLSYLVDLHRHVIINFYDEADSLSIVEVDLA